MSDTEVTLIEELVEAARKVRLNAHAPYSRFKVGAAFRLRDGRIVSGINLENCSYGLTVCAERNALATAAAAGAGSEDLVALAVVVDADRAASPCGACRQVLAELAPLGLPIVLHNIRDGETVMTSLGELLPRAFLPESLRASVDHLGD